MSYFDVKVSLIFLGSSKVCQKSKCLKLICCMQKTCQNLQEEHDIPISAVLTIRKAERSIKKVKKKTY